MDPLNINLQRTIEIEPVTISLIFICRLLHSFKITKQKQELSCDTSLKSEIVEREWTGTATPHDECSWISCGYMEFKRNKIRLDFIMKNWEN